MTTEKSPSLESRKAPSGHGRLGMHYAILVFGLIICGWGIWRSGRDGLSTLLSSYASATSRLDAADKAVQLSPSSSEAHYLRASLLNDKERRAEAIKEYERAVTLRPSDYVFWLELGRARDQANDLDGALAAFRESARLAPFYAKPHWQLGNTLLRSGRRDEAFAELRRAATSNPKVLPQAIGLAWAAFGGDSDAVEYALQPQTPSAHLALASFLARRGKASESIAQFRAAGALSREQRRVLVEDLLAAGSFAEAFEVWSSGRPLSGPGDIAVIANGGFEEPIVLDDPGFGWQLGNVEALRISLDTNEPRNGIYSLRLDWSGESDPSSAAISQLGLVKPKTRYRLKFAARVQELQTIGFPIATVVDAGDDKKIVLGQSRALPQGTSGWQDYLTEFTTGEKTSAVQIIIRRESCVTAPCAVFGHVWFDDFSIGGL